MSADDRRRGERASQQVEDRFEAGYAAGSDGGGGEHVWEKAPESPGGWEILGSRGGAREAALRRVEAHPEVMPPHPQPVDRHLEKKRAEPSFAARAVPVAAGMFLVGLLLPRMARGGWRSRRRQSAAGPVLALRARGWRSRRDAARIAEILRGQRFRGEIVFE